MLCWFAFLLVPVLGSTGSATGRPALFVGFAATMTESDFSESCIIGFGSSPSRCGPASAHSDVELVNSEISQFLHEELAHMPGSATTPDW